MNAITLLVVIAGFIIIYIKQEKLMSAIDDLEAAETNLETLGAALLTDITTLTAELAAANTSQDPRIAAVVTKMQTLATSFQAALPNVTPPAA